MLFFSEAEIELGGPQLDEKRDGNDAENDNNSKHQELDKSKSTIAWTS